MKTDAKRKTATRTKRKHTNAKAKTTKSTRAGKRAKGRAGLSKVAGLMRGIDLCMMTTHRKDGSMHARPMSNNGEVSFDGTAWFFTSRETPKVAELEEDDRVALSFVGGSKGKPVWIAVNGTAEIVDDAAKKKELWVKELDRWFENGPEDPSVVLICVQADHATWWSGEEQGEVDLGH